MAKQAPLNDMPPVGSEIIGSKMNAGDMPLPPDAFGGLPDEGPFGEPAPF